MRQSTSMKKILELIASDEKRAFWITAPSKVNKIHFLNSLASVLVDDVDKRKDTWQLEEDEIMSYRSRLQNLNLFPIIFSLPPAVQAQKHQVLDSMDCAIEEALKRRSLQTDISIMTSREIYEWYKNLPTDLRIELDFYIRSQVHFYVINNANSSPDQNLSKIINLDKLADLILEYCRSNNIHPKVTSSFKQRVEHIYEKITNLADGKLYTGLLFIVDELDFWQQSYQHDNPSFMEVADLLNTLVNLSQEENLKIYSFLISKKKIPTKISVDYLTHSLNINL
jgi:hypothetical protein